MMFYWRFQGVPRTLDEHHSAIPRIIRFSHWDLLSKEIDIVVPSFVWRCQDYHLFWIAIYGIGRSLSMLISSIREFWLTSPAAAANKTIEHRWSLPTRIDSIIIVSSNSSSGAIWNIIIKIIITEFAVDKFDSVNDQRQSPYANDR